MPEVTVRLILQDSIDKYVFRDESVQISAKDYRSVIFQIRAVADKLVNDLAAIGLELHDKQRESS